MHAADWRHYNNLEAISNSTTLICCHFFFYCSLGIEPASFFLLLLLSCTKRVLPGCIIHHSVMATCCQVDFCYCLSVDLNCCIMDQQRQPSCLFRRLSRNQTGIKSQAKQLVAPTTNPAPEKVWPCLVHAESTRIIIVPPGPLHFQCPLQPEFCKPYIFRRLIQGVQRVYWWVIEFSAWMDDMDIPKMMASDILSIVKERSGQEKRTFPRPGQKATPFHHGSTGGFLHSF